MHVLTIYQPLLKYWHLQKQYAQIARRRYQPSLSLYLCHFSGMSQVSRRHKMSFRRRLPSHPPAVSAENMQFVQQLQHLPHF
jgi:hypothetical protein